MAFDHERQRLVGGASLKEPVDGAVSELEGPGSQGLSGARGPARRVVNRR